MQGPSLRVEGGMAEVHNALARQHKSPGPEPASLELRSAVDTSHWDLVVCIPVCVRVFSYINI